MDENKIKVIVVDDSPSFLEGLKLLLESDSRFEIISSFKNGKELIDSNSYLKADLVISDIEMPEMDGIEAAKLINFRRPTLPLLAMTIHLDEVYLKDLLGAGFKGIVYKLDILNELFPSIDKVLEGQLVFPQQLKTLKK